ncbi:ABC transporter permease [Cerasicoccus maritimus]|uniref:ABC transporter permease n=1 Tax=Cerasicoccus maritimus TaxID=490089 RepID=UPI002852628F|nr:ABC transporter permease subunit [Cerasicoccus maritimus]
MRVNWLLAGVAAIAAVGLVWTPYDPLAQDFRELRLAGFGAAHWLGVDGLGRDVLSRLWRGLGNTAGLSLLALGLNFVVAAAMLTVEETTGRIGRTFVPLVASVWLGLPVIFLSLILLVFLPPGGATLVLAVALGNASISYRQLRISWREQIRAPYVEASETMGASGWGFFRRTLWPNLAPDVVALARLIFALCALELSGLAFLGLIGDPDFPELGAMLRQNQAYLTNAPWLLLLPGSLLSGLLLVVHLSGHRVAQD